MSELEPDKGKKPADAPKESNKPKPKESTTTTAPKKSVWDLPDGEYSEVFDSEGHRNRINHY